MFAHRTDIPKYDLKTIERGTIGRFYITPNGNKYPSVTTVLSTITKQKIMDWRESVGAANADREMKRCAARGTAVHSMVEDYLNNKTNVIAGHDQLHASEFSKIRPHLNKIDNILMQEGALWSDTLRLAGRVDCVAEYKGELAVIDFKTSTNNKTSDMIDTYWMQTAAYALMLDEMYNIRINKAVIIMTVERGLPLVFTSSIEQHIEPLVRCISAYHKKKTR